MLHPLLECRPLPTAHTMLRPKAKAARTSFEQHATGRSNSLPRTAATLDAGACIWEQAHGSARALVACLHIRSSYRDARGDMEDGCRLREERRRITAQVQDEALKCMSSKAEWQPNERSQHRGDVAPILAQEHDKERGQRVKAW